MKKFAKFCCVAGLILLFAGIGIAAVSAGLGGHFTDTIPGRLWSGIRYYTDNGGWDDFDSQDWDSGWTQWEENDLPSADTQDAASADHHAGDTPQASGTMDAAGSADAVGSAGAADGNSPGEPSGGTTRSFNTTRKLDVDMDRGSVRIYEKQDISQIEVNIKDPSGATQCYMDDGTLKIKRDDNYYRKDPKVEILIPQSYKFDKISLDMGAAECHLDQLKTAKLDIDTGVGAVVFTGTITGNAEIEAGVGDVTLNLTGKEEDYNYSVECGVGKIQVGSHHYSLLSHKSYINNNAPRSMELECGVGTVTVNFDDSK